MLAGTSIRFPFWEPNRRPKTGFEVVAARRQVSGFTANPSSSSGAGKSGEKIVSLVGLSGNGARQPAASATLAAGWRVNRSLV